VLFRSSERRRAAIERLRENEEDLRITLECIGDGVIATDAAGRVVRMSSAAERSTGFKREDAVGKRLDAILRAVDRKTHAPLESPFDRVARTGSAAGLAETAVLVSPDGTERALLRSGAPILSRLGILRGVVLVLGERRKHAVTRSG
jgi:PAS domain S-box-containing protein